MTSERSDWITGPLYWEQLGKEGPPMVFVHPNPTDHNAWIYQMTHLSTWFRTIGIDLPGYGRSPQALSGVSMTDVARACWEAVDRVCGDRAILAGCSVGYTTALHMARQQPDRVSALILSGCSYRAVKTFAAQRIAAFERLGLGYRREYFFEVVGPEFRKSRLAEYFADMFAERNPSADLGSIINVFRALGEPDPDWLFDSLKAPVLIITGSEDHAHESAFALQRRIAGAELETINGAGHACNIEQPWAWDALAIRFLRKNGLFPDGERLGVRAVQDS